MRVLLIDDDKKITEGISQMIKMLAIPVTEIEVVHSVPDAIALIPDYNPEVVFLDIEIGNQKGMEVLEAISKPNFYLIFITAHQKYAIEGFNYSALDFLLKPIDPFQLQKVFNKIDKETKYVTLKEQVDLLKEIIKKDGQTDKLVLRNSDGIFLENIQDIIRCEADGSYTTFTTLNGDRIVVSKVLKEYDDLLKNKGFIRVHNSHLVNINHIKKITKSDHDIVLSNNERVPISQRKKVELLQLINEI